MEEEKDDQVVSSHSFRATMRDDSLQGEVYYSFHPPPMQSFTLRDFIAMLFRRRVLILISFLAVLLVVVLATWLLPKQYESQMKILVKRERIDPLLTANPSVQSWTVKEITLEDLNSEVVLLKSRDLLEEVVRSCSLHKIKKNSFFSRLLGSGESNESDASSEDLQIPEAIRKLEQALEVELIPNSKFIEVRYTSSDPQLSARVLKTLAARYLEKHLAIHRSAGAFDFFQQETDLSREKLKDAEEQLAEFSRNKEVISIGLEKDIILRKLNDFERMQRETKASEVALEKRISSLESQSASTPKRIVTQVKTSDNASLIQQLRKTLLDLELKRTDLLSKYNPGYRTVEEVETEIARTREALVQAEQATTRDETTELDRTYQWLDEELARTRAELATLRARSSEIGKAVEVYRDSAKQITGKEIEHQDLVRAAKMAEENYVLYLRKQEDARISDALDRMQIINVAIAESAAVPVFATSPRWGLNLAIGFVLALLVSLLLAFVVDNLDQSFRTPSEVEHYLGIPVLATMSRAKWGRQPGYSLILQKNHDSQLLQTK